MSPAMRRAMVFARMSPTVCRAFGAVAGNAALGCDGSIVERADRASALLDDALEELGAELEFWLAEEADQLARLRGDQ